MTHSALMFVFSVMLSVTAMAHACVVDGTVYDAAGQPLRDAVVRLIDVGTQNAAFVIADSRATFSVNVDSAADDSGRYRIDVLGKPTAVTGSHIVTRSIIGMSPTFACNADASTRQDAHVLID